MSVQGAVSTDGGAGEGRDRQAVLRAPSPRPVPRSLLQDWMTIVQGPNLPRQELILELTSDQGGTTAGHVVILGGALTPSLPPKRLKLQGWHGQGRSPQGPAGPQSPHLLAALPVNGPQNPLYLCLSPGSRAELSASCLRWLWQRFLVGAWLGVAPPTKVPAHLLYRTMSGRQMSSEGIRMEVTFS